MNVDFILQTFLKVIVHSKMKISPWFTHPQAILGVYDFLLSDEYNQSSSKLYNGSERWWRFWSLNSVSIHHEEVLHVSPGG